jgi:hypothetical protein
VGIEIENVPTTIVESDKQLEELEKNVFPRQKVSSIKVLNNKLRIKFGITPDCRGIEKIARDLKWFLTQLKVPFKLIDGVVIVPHTDETWARDNSQKINRSDFM